MRLIDETRPSHYDPAGRWCCTIGKAESEEAARALCWYLAENGDEWRPVRLDVLEPWARERGISFIGSWRYLFAKPDEDEAEEIAMPAHWLRFIQHARRRMQGPPEIVLDGDTVQYLWPHGQRLAASFDHDAAELDKLRARQPRSRPRVQTWEMDENDQPRGVAR